MSLSEGKPAPDFTMPTDGGGRISLSDLKGSPFVLYFYPKDDTPGCTTEACAFRDHMSAFSELGAKIIGVSRDPVNSHDKFKAKYELPFMLASDENGRTTEAYGTWVEKNMYGRKYMGVDRATFLIDCKGVVRKIWRQVKVPGHVEAVLQATREL